MPRTKKTEEEKTIKKAAAKKETAAKKADELKTVKKEIAKKDAAEKKAKVAASAAESAVAAEVKKTAARGRKKAAEAAAEAKTPARGRKKAAEAAAETKTAARGRKKAADKVSETKTVNKEAAKSEAASMILELGNNKYDLNGIQEAVKNEVSANIKGKIKSVDIYVKPADDAAYYVVNGKGDNNYKIALDKFRK